MAPSDLPRRGFIFVLIIGILGFFFLMDTPRSALRIQRPADVWSNSPEWSPSYRPPDASVRALRSSKRVLITGAAGFLGSHLVDAVLAAGHRVIALDDFSTGRQANLAHVVGDSRVTIIRHDVIEPIFFDVDYIFHLASPASPPSYQRDPIRTLRTNVWGAHNMLRLANATNARFFLASTSEVYGDPLVHPQKETYWGNVNPDGVRACYDEGKRAAETLTFDFHRQWGVDVRIVRIFNTFGPRMDVHDGRVVSNFIVRALQGRPLPVHGDGNQTRSIQYVSDLIDGFLRLMERPFAGRPVNIGNPVERTVLELADLVSAAVGVPLRLEHLPPAKDDPKRRRPDIELATQHLGWQPRVSAEVGLNRTVPYFRAELERLHLL
eukprot:TRINITY_DN4002_c0_g1_i1.p1 TRINITY_DN4002_c0_g1~~TRINITY_DN4002_c0_g1_i1.p1  ORF type:complete len:380 (-),score=69.05 TRINITY_DN4002_c0_g1_i1:157-1296(-)